MKILIVSLIGAFSIVAAYAEKPAAEKPAKDAAGEKVVKAAGAVKCAHCDLDIKSDCQKAIETAKGKVILLDGDAVKTFFEANKKAKRVRVSGTTAKDGKNTVMTVKTIEIAKGKKKDAAPDAKPELEKKPS